MKICLASSTGGHLGELKKIIPAVNEHNYFIITEQSEMSRTLKDQERVYFLAQQERKNLLLIIHLLLNLLLSVYILMKERPKVIITTGAGAVLGLCLLGKIFGSKIVYIESFAKVYTASVTGRLIYHIADQFYIQWEQLREVYPDGTYRGSL
ncbi:PssD/Cps14F family polysaccharide biosynthesis glycosyltransferase [Paenibacillus qinlingensis]|uniref:PssD/Cps14F family polysaccharide biosynthesis glycosyltransferase n=1 Tax=Paenibacillus qinlingensis TaxID=1837343 RepID=UPI00156708CD|nr:PssD/Cps14F family polysaccharide biosynthesis glycosyltransferase [Paenibacillus qinlingensis]NQX60417.1 polysaccharide biosynthesis protein [Paenibacillus qinlingensis]